MPFRISDATVFSDAVRHARRNRFALHELQGQISSGRRITSVADHPSDAARILALRRAGDHVTQLQRNIDARTFSLTRSSADFPAFIPSSRIFFMAISLS